MKVTGFPSPADEYGTKSLSLDQHLIPHPTSTFFVRVTERLASHIHPGDLLVVDRSLTPQHMGLVLVVVHGTFCLRQMRKDKDGLWLFPLGGPGDAFLLREDDDSTMWGVVTYVIHRTLVA